MFQWLRGYYIVGNSKFGSSIFSKITAAVDEGKTEFPFTLGQNQYDFIDYPDFCAQVAAVVGQKNEQGIINICSGKPEKLADRVERFIKEMIIELSCNMEHFQIDRMTPRQFGVMTQNQKNHGEPDKLNDRPANDAFCRVEWELYHGHNK